MTRPSVQRPRIAFLDRDGTLIRHIPYLHDPSQVELLPSVVQGLQTLRSLGYTAVLVSNQSGVGRGYFSHEAAESVNQELNRQLRLHNCTLDHMFFCPHNPSDSCNCRKPLRGMVDRALEACSFPLESETIDCIVVGDSACDIKLARTIGCVSYQLPHLTGDWDDVVSQHPIHRCQDWDEIIAKLTGP